MLIYNIVYVFLWGLFLRFLFLLLRLFAKDLPVVSLAILSLFLQLFLNKLVHLSLFALLRVDLDPALRDLLLSLAFLLFLLLFSFSTFFLLLVLPDLLECLSRLLLDLRHVLANGHVLWVLALAARRLLHETLWLLLLHLLLLLLVLLLEDLCNRRLLVLVRREGVLHHFVQLLAVQCERLDRVRSAKLEHLHIVGAAPAIVLPFVEGDQLQVRDFGEEPRDVYVFLSDVRLHRRLDEQVLRRQGQHGGDLRLLPQVHFAFFNFSSAYNYGGTLLNIINSNTLDYRLLD